MVVWRYETFTSTFIDVMNDLIGSLKSSLFSQMWRWQCLCLKQYSNIWLCGDMKHLQAH